MRKVCMVAANLKDLMPIIREKFGKSGDYWILEYTLVIRFGGTKVRAFVEWKHEVCF
jgi:hypothetical protein